MDPEPGLLPSRGSETGPEPGFRPSLESGSDPGPGFPPSGGSSCVFSDSGSG